MALHKITKGLDLPMKGGPTQVIRETRRPTRVAVMADDFPGLRRIADAIEERADETLHATR